MSSQRGFSLYERERRSGRRLRVGEAAEGVVDIHREGAFQGLGRHGVGIARSALPANIQPTAKKGSADEEDEAWHETTSSGVEVDRRLRKQRVGLI